jgi:integrase
MNRQSPLPEGPIRVLIPPAKVLEILAGIDLSTHCGRRDRAMILMSYSGVRQGAALSTRIEDLLTRKGRLWLRVRRPKVCMREE